MAVNFNKLREVAYTQREKQGKATKEEKTFLARNTLDKAAKDATKNTVFPSSADLYRQADITGTAKGQGTQNLPSGAPVVRPAVQKSIDDYKAIDKAAETLAKHGELTEKDAETLGKARNAVMADAAAYDAVAAEQTPKMFADKVQGASERDRLNWRNMSASETAKGKDAADQGVFAGNRLTERAEDYYAHYNRILDKYSRGTATADDIKALAMEQNRLNDDRNAYTESTAGKFETAIKNAYDKSKGIGTWKDIHVGKNSAVSLPKGYNKAALDKDTDDFKAFYRDVYGKFINGKVSVSELAEVKARENELRGKNAAYYDTIDGLAEKGKEYQKNAAALALPKKRAEQIYDDAERRMHEAADLYDKVRLDTEASEEVKAKYLKDYQVADRNYRIALKNKRAADSAYEAARANIAYNDIAIEFGKYNNEYVAAKKAGYKDPADVRKNMVQAVNANADDAATYHVDDLQRYGTNEWKRIYLYLRETKGAKAANEFAKTIKPLVDVRHANISAREYEGSGFIGKVGIGVSSQVSGGLSDFGMGVVGAVKGFTGDDSYTFPTTAQSVASAVRNEEKGVVAGAAMDILRSSANMAPSIALGTFTSAAGFPMAAGVLQSLSFGLSAGGNAYIQSINEGKDAGEAFLYGAVSGASEVLLERAIGGIAGFGTSGATKFLETRAGKTVRRRLAELLSQNVNSVSDRLRVQTISALGRFISNGLSEGVEEFSQELLDPIFRNMILAEENEVFTEKNFKDALYAGAIGFINSALLNLPNEYMQSGALRNLLRGQASDTDINTVLSSPELIRDVERIFTYQLNMTTDEGGFRFSDNDIINRTFLEMLNRGAAMGTKNADNVRRAAKEAGFSENTAENASAADVASALAESINKASDSKTDLAAKEIRKDVKTDKAAEIKNEAAKRVDAIANEQLEEIRQKAQAQRIQDEEYQPIASSRGELAKFIDSRAGKEIWVDGEKRTVKGGSKGAIQTIKENGTVVTDTLAGGEMTYNKHGFSITSKNGTTHEFYFGKNVGIKAEKTQAAGAQKAEQAEKELAETSSIEPEKPVEDYPYNQREAIEGYADGVDDRILEFLTRVRKLQDHSYRQKTNVEIAQNTERLINDVRELVGTDVTGYKHLLTGGAVEHIDKDHGQNGLSDHSMANDEDIARIGFVIENYDSVERLKDKNGKDVLDVAHQNKDSSPSRVVRFSKKINGTFYVVESVPDSKAKAMYVKSAYIQKNNSANTDEMLNVLDVRPQSPRSLRPETLPHSDSTAAKDSIRGKDVGNVNENVNVLQNETDSAALTLDMSKVKSTDINVSGTEMIRFLKAQLDNYFKHGGTDSSLLNEKTPERQLETMKKLFGTITEKPSWLTDKDFADYEALVTVSNERNSEKADVSATKALPIPVNVSEVKADLVGKFKGLFGNDEQVSNLYNKFADHVLKLAKEEERVPKSEIFTFVNAVLDSTIAENGSIDVDRYKELRRYVWKTPITVSKTVRGDFANWNEFKHKAYKYMRFINSEGDSKYKGKRSIDTMWGELCEEFPSWFKDKVTNNADQIRALYNVLSALDRNVPSMNEVISADEKNQIVENVSDYVEKALNNYRLMQLGKSNRTPTNFAEMVEADVSDYFREHSGEEVLVNGEKMKIHGVKGNAISVLRENGSEARVHLTRTNTEFNDNGFTVTFLNGRKADFIFPGNNSQEYLSDVEIRRELGLLSDDELAKEEVGDIEDDGISWIEVFPDTESSVEDKKEDLPQVNPQLYKRLAIINGKSSFDNSIAQSSENVNAETPVSEAVSKNSEKPSSKSEEVTEESARQTVSDSMEQPESKSGSDAVSDSNNSDKEAKNDVSETAREAIENIKQTAQSPKEALKNLRKSDTFEGTDENTIRAVGELAKAFSVRILLFDGNSKTDIDGFYDRRANTIYLNAGGHAKPIQATVRHEMIHFLAQANKGAFESFRDFVAAQYAETYGKDALNTWLDDKKAEYETAGIELDDNGAKEELCADLAMDMLTDPETVKGFAKENRSAARRILDALRRFIDKIRALLGLEPKYSAGKANALEALAKTDSTVKVTDGKVERSHASFKNDTLPKALNVKDLYAAEKLLYDTLVSDEVRNGNASSDGIRFSGETESNTDIITVKDIDNLRSIGRKSVNDFTPEDIKKAEPFARRYFKELGVKSPFFRAWFGDWRAADIKGKTDISVIPEYIDSNEARKSNRGMVSNKDTGWDIKISREGETNTISHSGSDRLSEYGLAGIKQLIENAILLDCEVHEHHSNNNKIDRIAFDHKFYALGNQNRQVALYKITVEEYFQSKSEPANKKFHNLKYIEKVADLSADALSDNNRSGGSANDKSATTYSISDLYALVKAYDKDFHAKDANPALLDKDGKPLVVYHGTKDRFTEFILQKEPKFGRALGDGFYFTSDYTKAHQYANGIFSKGQDRGGIVMPVYLNMRNPYIIKADADRTTWGREYRNGDYDGIIDEKYNTYYVENPTQIKSATDNIGTFDGANPDIRYSKSDTAADTKKNVFSYEALTAKPDMPLTDINTNVPRDENGKVIRKDVADLAIQAVRDSGNKKNTDVDFYVHVDDTNSDLKVNVASVRHSLTRKPDLNAIAALNIVGLAKNAVLVNELSPRGNSNGGNIYLSVGKDSDSNLYFVRMITDKRGRSIEEIETVYAISTKKESVAHYRQGYGNESSFAFTDSTISIADLLDFVKNHFSDILPESVLQHYGISRKESAVSNSVMYSLSGEKKIQPGKKNGYSFRALTAKSDMPITKMRNISESDYAAYRADKSSFVKDMVRRAALFENNPNNTDTQTYIHNKDTGKDILVSRESFRHGAARMDEEYVQICKNIGSLLRNAVAVNELQSRDNGENSTVFIGMAENKNNYVFVRMITENRTQRLVSYDILYSIRKKSAKKEDVGKLPPDYTASGGSSYTSSAISIAKLLENVKREKLFSGILSADVKNALGIDPLETSANIDGVMYSLNTDKDSVQTIPKGEDPARDVDVRAFDERGGKVSEGIRTVAEASVTPDSYVKPLLEDVAKGKYSHEIKTNKKAMARAENVITRDGYQETAERYLQDFEDGRSFGKDDIAVLQTLYAGAAQHMDYLSGADSDITLAEKLVVAMVQTATNAGQALQAQRLLKKLSPEGTLYAYEKSVNRINRAIERTAGEWDGEKNTRVKESGKGFFKQLVDSAHNGYYSPKQAPVEIDPKLKKQLLNAKNPHEMDKVCEEIENDVAKQILSTVPDKLRAWRYMSMLTNPRTHVRNLVGNALFGVTVQTRDIIGTIAERAIIRDKSKRTKAIAWTPKQRSEYKAIAKYAARFYDEHEAFVKGESNRYDMTTSNIEAEKKPFRSRFLGAILNVIYEFNSNLLEKEDLWFIKGHFVRQFTHALMAKGYTAEQLKNGEVPAEVLQKIAEYASNEAQKATFRDANAAATMLNRIENMNRVSKVAVSAIMPFKKTPMNILRRGIEYSPVSLITAVYKTISQNVQKSKGRIKSVDTAGIINDLSQGLTGTMIFVLGVWLLSEGILKAGDDEDDKKQNLEEAMGKQSYSIEIGGESFTLDWAAPLCMPLFAGAEFAKALQEKEISPLQVLLRMSDPVLETSMMSGVLDFISSAKYADGDSGVVQRMVQSAFSSYVLQFFPTAMGAAARVMDEYESRTTRTDKKGDAAFWERLGRQIINKIPYARQVFNKPYVDLFGKQEKKERPLDYAISLVKNTIVPGYITSVSGTKSEKILYEVMEESKETKFIPGFVKKFTVDKVEHTLTQEEYYNYHVMRGEWYETYLPEIASEEWFTDLEADEKAIVLESFKKIADDLTKKRVIPEYDIHLNRSKYLYRMLYGDEPVSEQEAVNVVKQAFHGIVLTELAKKQAEEERAKLLEAEPAEDTGK